MARYTGPITKKSRRLKTDLVGGDKNFDLRPFPPGQHGRRRIQEKEYLTQLQEKQKARFTYGVMEKQFRRYYKEAANRPGKTGENILTILESRLDNVVYRAGIARTRRQARQLVTHGHFLVNGTRVDVPSYGWRRTTSSPSDRSRSRPFRSSWRGRPTATVRCRPGCRSCRTACRSSSTSCRRGPRSTRSSPSSSTSSTTRRPELTTPDAVAPFERAAPGLRSAPRTEVGRSAGPRTRHTRGVI